MKKKQQPNMKWLFDIASRGIKTGMNDSLWISGIAQTAAAQKMPISGRMFFNVIKGECKIYTDPNFVGIYSLERG